MGERERESEKRNSYNLKKEMWKYPGEKKVQNLRLQNIEKKTTIEIVKWMARIVEMHNHIRFSFYTHVRFWKDR